MYVRPISFGQDDAGKVQPAGGEAPATAVEGILSPAQQRACVRLARGCSGVLIDPRIVLTAAHCIRDLETGRLGLFRGGATVSVVDYGCDPATRIWARIEDVKESMPGVPWADIDLDSYGNDTALLLLEAPFPAEHVQPLDRGLAPDEGETIILGGFSPWADCPQRGYGRFVVTKRNLTSVECRAVGEGTALRPGDSGGPAIRVINGRPNVFGVNSAQGPVVSRADTLEGWINDTIRWWKSGGRSDWYEPLPDLPCEERYRWIGGACSLIDIDPESPAPVPPPELPPPLPAPEPPSHPRVPDIVRPPTEEECHARAPTAAGRVWTWVISPSGTVTCSEVDAADMPQTTIPVTTSHSSGMLWVLGGVAVLTAAAWWLWRRR